MRAKISIIVLVLTSVIVAAVGCQHSIDLQDIEIRLAPIHEVKIFVNMSSPEQIFVYIKGGLSDSCTTLHELKTEYIDNTIKITVTTQRPVDVECAQVYSYFEENVALGSNFASGKTYTVDVNGVIEFFKYP